MAIEPDCMDSISKQDSVLPVIDSLGRGAIHRTARLNASTWFDLSHVYRT